MTALLMGDELVVSQTATRLHSANEYMLRAANLYPFAPRMIISHDNLNSILSYLTHHFHGVRQSPHFVFSAVSLAQLLMVNVEALSNLEDIDHEVALWWLVGYWILYVHPDTREQAQWFLATAPPNLRLEAAQRQLTRLQPQAANILALPDVILLFDDGYWYTFSTAWATLNRLQEGEFGLSQMPNPGGVLVILRHQGAYHVITPYNHLFIVKDRVPLLTLIARIALKPHWSVRAKTFVMDKSLMAGVGAVVGAITATPLFVLSLSGLGHPGAVSRAYFIWVVTSAVVFSCFVSRHRSVPVIYNDITPGRERLPDRAEEDEN